MRAPGRTREVVTTRTATRAAAAGAAALVLMTGASANPSPATTEASAPAHPAAPVHLVAAGPLVSTLLAERAERVISPPVTRAGRLVRAKPRRLAGRTVRHRSEHRWKPAAAARRMPARHTAARHTKAQARATVTHTVRRRAGGLGRAVEFALKQRGEWYAYGSSGPDRWDCSGLMMRSFAQAGIRLPRRAAEQSSRGRAVSRRQARPGDLVLWGGAGSAYHVGMYLGGGRVLHSPRAGKTVRVASLWGSPDFRRLR